MYVHLFVTQEEVISNSACQKYHQTFVQLALTCPLRCWGNRDFAKEEITKDQTDIELEDVSAYSTIFLPWLACPLCYSGHHDICSVAVRRNGPMGGQPVFTSASTLPVPDKDTFETCLADPEPAHHCPFPCSWIMNSWSMFPGKWPKLRRDGP